MRGSMTEGDAQNKRGEKDGGRKGGRDTQAERWRETEYCKSEKERKRAEEETERESV